MAFCNDIQTIIDTWIHCYRLKRLKDEYRRIWHFIDNIRDFICPNPQGRCVTIYQNATVHYLNGMLHRTLRDNPAVIWENGHKEWWFQNQLHRIDKHAVEWSDGTKEWWFHDQRHRPLSDGPAIEYANGDKAWWVNGQRIKSYTRFKF